MNSQIPYNNPKYKRLEHESMYTWEQRVFHVMEEDDRKKYCESSGRVCDKDCRMYSCTYRPEEERVLN